MEKLGVRFFSIYKIYNTNYFIAENGYKIIDYSCNKDDSKGSGTISCEKYGDNVLQTNLICRRGIIKAYLNIKTETEFFSPNEWHAFKKFNECWNEILVFTEEKVN